MENLNKTIEHLNDAEYTITRVDAEILPAQEWATLFTAIHTVSKALKAIKADEERKRKEEAACTATTTRQKPSA